MVGTSPPNVSSANADLNVGTNVLNRNTAEHKPPTAGSASGRIKSCSDNSKRSRHRSHRLGPLKESILTLEATTRNRVVKSAGGTGRGSDRSFSRRPEYCSVSKAHSRHVVRWRFS